MVDSDQCRYRCASKNALMVSRSTVKAIARLALEAPRRHFALSTWPLVIFGVLGAFLAVGLTLNPREIPSPLVGKPVLQFQLAPVKGRTLGLASGDLRGEVSIVNVFAWCTACREEHPLWMELARQRALPIHGLNYKDAPDAAARWLQSE